VTRDIANQHWSAAFEDLVADLGGEFRHFGAVAAFVGNLPLPFANGCLVLRPAEPDDLAAALDWVVSARVPFQARIDENVLTRRLMTVLDRRELVEDEPSMPAMVLTPIPDSPPPADGVAVATVTPATYDEFVAIMVSTGIPAQYATQIFPAGLLELSNASYFLASLDGERVGISAAVRTADTGGVYSVATVETARRRGVGSAVTWAAVDAIRDWGCSAAVLQSSEMGYSVYQAMGFREVTRYRRFSPPS
jgi:GNAT superfamily N-acetyltransferase